MGTDEPDALRLEVERLQGELARERARGEAARIAFEAALADANEIIGGEGAPAPLLYAWGDAPQDNQVIRIRVGDRDVTAVVGPEWGDMRPGSIWAEIQRLAGEAS